jgi:hypothetical protein
MVSFLLLTTLILWFLVAMGRRYAQHLGSHAQYKVYLDSFTKHDTSHGVTPMSILYPLVLWALSMERCMTSIE